MPPGIIPTGDFGRDVLDTLMRKRERGCSLSSHASDLVKYLCWKEVLEWLA